MATMQWDDELAFLAAINVQCSTSQDSCHNTDAFRSSGQNLGWYESYGDQNYMDMAHITVDMWYLDMYNCNMDYIKSYPNNVPLVVLNIFQILLNLNAFLLYFRDIGNFTLLVTDRNTRVGCAIQINPVPNKVYKLFRLVCNYATTNKVGSSVYASCSNAATSCTSGVNANYTNLCSTSEVY